MTSLEPDVLDTPSAGPTAIRGSAVRIVGYVVGLLAALGSASLLFRHLGVGDTGRYVTVLSLVTIVQGLTDAGLTAIAVREASTRIGADRRDFLSQLLGLRLALTVTGVLFVAGFAVVAGYGRTLVLGTLISGAALIVVSAQTQLGSVLLAGLQVGWVTAAELVRQVGTAVAIVALVLAGATLLPIFAAPIAASLGALLLVVALVRRTAGVRPAADLGMWRRILRETIPFAAATAVYVLYFRVTLVLMSVISNEDQLGYFGASFRIIETLIVIPAVAITTVFPIFARAARDDRARLRYAVTRTVQASLLLGSFLALGLVVGAPVAIHVVAGGDFDPAITVLRIQALTLIPAFVGLAWGHALLSLHRHRALLIVSLGALAATSVASGVLAATGGARGAAVATVLGEVVVAGGMGVALHRAQPGMLLSLRYTATVLGAAALGAAVILVPGLPALVATAIALSVYGVLLVVLRAIPEELLAELPPRRRTTR